MHGGHRRNVSTTARPGQSGSRASKPATPRAGELGHLLSVAEASDYLNVTERFVRRIISERRIPVIRLGRHVRLAQTDLDDFVTAGRSPVHDVSPYTRQRLTAGGQP